MISNYGKAPDIIYKDTPIKDSYSLKDIDNNFIAFTSIDNILYIIYTNKSNSIVLYNLIDNKKINEIKNAHQKKILSFKYYFDNINKRDLIISSSGISDVVKIWDVQKLECIFTFSEMISACFLKEKNDIFIAGCKDEKIIIFNLNGNIIKEIQSYKYSENYIDNYIDSYYDNKLLLNYIIITSNDRNIISYDYEKNKILWEYSDGNCLIYSRSIAIVDDNEILKLISACWTGTIRIWNFRSSELLSTIKVSYEHICGICLWDSRYLFVGCGDKKLKLIDLKSYKKLNEFEGHNDYVMAIKKIIHPRFGECLLTQGYIFGNIKLWIIQDEK